MVAVAAQRVPVPGQPLPHKQTIANHVVLKFIYAVVQQEEQVCITIAKAILQHSRLCTAAHHHDQQEVILLLSW